MAAALLAATSLPAGASIGGRLDIGGISLWSHSVEVEGLNATDTARLQVLWGEFVTGLPGQSACLLASPPTIVAKTDMRPRAAYAPHSATLYVQPGDLDRLVVFHELAHHLDFTCGAADRIGAAVRAAQGIDPSRPWWRHGDPVTWPAEYFANAIAIALGEPSRHAVTEATVEVVSEWAGIAGDAPDPAIILDTPQAGPHRIL